MVEWGVGDSGRCGIRDLLIGETLLPFHHNLMPKNRKIYAEPEKASKRNVHERWVLRVW